MLIFPAPKRLFILFAVAAAVLVSTFTAFSQQPSSGTETIQINSRLVFLDVTVLDRKGNPVVKGLTKDDFLITEDHQPESIFSFQAPETHVVDVTASDDTPSGTAPVTIFVLDLLNSRFQDFAYIRYEVKKYLDAQPERLNSPAELMVLGNESLQMVQGYTRNKADLLFALKHIPPVLPYKQMNGAFFAERFSQSVDALQQVALQNRGVAGRKNIIWVGHGAPSLNTDLLNNPELTQELNQYVHDTTNMLVDSRVSLFVIYPGLSLRSSIGTFSALSADADTGDSDPFAGDINFGVFVNETGGKLFYNRNDVNTEIKESEELGSNYYTLTYQPHGVQPNGRFRRIRVTMRNPELRALTKTGYFAPEGTAGVDARQQALINISEAARSTIPYTALHLTVSNLIQHPDTHTADFTVTLQPANLMWESVVPDQNVAAGAASDHASAGSTNANSGKSTTSLILATASLSSRQDILASRIESLGITANSQNPAVLAKSSTHFPLTVRVPRKTATVRIVLQARKGGQIGTANIDRKAIDSAPSAPTPAPTLQQRAPGPPAPKP